MGVEKLMLKLTLLAVLSELAFQVIYTWKNCAAAVSIGYNHVTGGHGGATENEVGILSNATTPTGYEINTSDGFGC